MKERTKRKKTLSPKLIERKNDVMDRVARFPLQEPSVIIQETSEWQTKHQELKHYPGVASFILSERS